MSSRAIGSIASQGSAWASSRVIVPIVWAAPKRENHPLLARTGNNNLSFLSKFVQKNGKKKNVIVLWIFSLYSSGSDFLTYPVDVVSRLTGLKSDFIYGVEYSFTIPFLHGIHTYSLL